VAETAAQAETKLKAGRFELIVLDLASPEALKSLRRSGAQRAGTPVICISDRRKPEASAEALRIGVADIIGRPLQHDEVLGAMANAKEMVRVARTPAPAVEQVEAPEGVFGASPAMRDVLGMVRRVAQSRCTVLVVGERGTGREMIARAIHTHGPRRDRPFLKVVCADASSAEFEQVLSGTVPDGSTVYLEEVRELAPELQVRLEARVSGLRPDHGVRFVGGGLPGIADAVDRGELRESLVDALSVVRIELPPLRQRPEDVPLLATHFLKQACRRSDEPAKAFSRAALTLLSALPWPGNAGELRSLTERLAVLVPRGIVLLEDVLANVRLDGSESVGRVRGSLKEARDQFERDYVTAVLQHHRGRMGAASRELGIERTNLYRKIKQLNIQWNIP
jgi:DNA-binding NtrC family response regulator